MLTVNTYNFDLLFTFRHVGNEGADEEDERVVPAEAVDHGDDEEDAADGERQPRHEPDEEAQVSGQRRLFALDALGQLGDPAHDGAVADGDDHPGGRALDDAGREEGQVFGLERVHAGAHRALAKGSTLTSQRGVVHPEVPVPNV